MFELSSYLLTLKEMPSLSILSSDWKSHGAEYYVCNRFNARKTAYTTASAGDASTPAVTTLASTKPNVRRLALNRYLFYLERVCPP